MNPVNGQMNQDIKKKAANAVSNLASDVKSGATSAVNDVKEDVKSIASDITRTDEAVTEGVQPQTMTQTLISSALALLPVQNADELYTRFEGTYDELRGSFVTARDSAKSFVKKYPVYSVLGAIAIGGAAAVYFTKRSSNRNSKRA